MRQPYPGIITFFLWGMLLSRILSHIPKDISRNAIPDVVCGLNVSGRS
jgi:hypothetical protein